MRNKCTPSMSTLLATSLKCLDMERQWNFVGRIASDDQCLKVMTKRAPCQRPVCKLRNKIFHGKHHDRGKSTGKCLQK